MKMLNNKLIKLCFFLALALLASYMSDTLSNPPLSAESLDYKKYYDSLSDQNLSSIEFNALKKRGDENIDNLTSSKNIKEDLNYIVSRKLIVIPLILFMWFMLGYKAGYKENGMLVVSVIVVMIAAMMFVSFIEALSYGALFCIGNFAMLKKARG